MFVSLHTDLAQPGTRIQRISRSSRVAKGTQEHIGITTLSTWAEWISPRLLRRGVAVAARWRLADHMPAPANVIVSTVRGPQRIGLVEGAIVQAIHSAGPLVEGVGLNVTGWSYGDALNLTAVASGAHRELLNELAADMGDEFERLLVDGSIEREGRHG